MGNHQLVLMKEFDTSGVGVAQFHTPGKKVEVLY